jgi:hypothetical protein
VPADAGEAAEMALLHIELEIDSEVYPELYARLASLSRAPAREEKLRQLAATGLLWELARLHGPALADLASAWPTVTASAGAVASAEGELVAGDAVAADQLLSGAGASSRAHDGGEGADAGPPEDVGVAVGAAAAPRPETAPDFVDLALDVPLDVLLDVPLHVPLDVPLDVPLGAAPDAAPVAAATPPPAPPDVPVLLDEVPPSLLHEVPAVTVAMVVPLHDEAAPTDAPRPEDHRDPVVRRPASRERLKRMRDRGLFQNG